MFEEFLVRSIPVNACPSFLDSIVQPNLTSAKILDSIDVVGQTLKGSSLDVLERNRATFNLVAKFREQESCFLSNEESQKIADCANTSIRIPCCVQILGLNVEPDNLPTAQETDIVDCSAPRVWLRRSAPFRTKRFPLVFDIFFNISSECP